MKRSLSTGANKSYIAGADLSCFLPAQGSDLWPKQQRGGWTAGQGSWLLLCLPPVQDMEPERPSSPSTVPGWHLPWGAAPCGVTGANCTHTVLCCSAHKERALPTSPWKVSSQSCCKSAAAAVTPTMCLSERIAF